MRFPVALIAIVLAVLCAVGCKQQTNTTAYGQTVDLQVDPPSVESGGTANITAEVKEVMMAKPGVKVTFSASGNCGSLSGTSGTTQSGTSVGLAGEGQAIVTYRGNSPYSTCSAIITATAQVSATSMVTVTPKALTRTAPDSSVSPGETPPSVTVIPDVTVPVSNGYSATYSITSNGADIDRIRIQTSQRAAFSTSNGANPPDNQPSANPKDAVLIEPLASKYNSDVLTITSDSLRLGRLTMTVTLRKASGGTVELRFIDPDTKEGVLPGPG